MTTERFHVQITEDGSRKVSRAIVGIGEDADNVIDKVDKLNRPNILDEFTKALNSGGFAANILSTAIGNILANLNVSEFIKWLDINTYLQNSLRALGFQGSELADVYERLFQVAQNTGGSFEDTVSLFGRMELTTRSLGWSTAELIDLTEQLGMAITLSGASGAQSEAVMRNLGDAMGMGVLRGQELNSIMMNAPVIAESIANHLGITIGELKKYGEQGKLTAQVVKDALSGAADSLEQRFEDTGWTISEAFVRVRNAFIKLVGDFDAGTRSTEGLVAAVFWLTENLEEVVKAAVSVASALALAFARKGVDELIKGVRLLYVTLAAHPVMAILMAITGVVSYIALMRDEILLGVDDVTTLGDFFRAMGEAAQIAFALVVEAFEVFRDAFAHAWDTLTSIYARFFGGLIDAWNNFFEGTGTGLVGFGKSVARVIDRVFGLFTGLIFAIVEVLKRMPALVVDYTKRVLNGLMLVVETHLNAFINTFNRLNDILGLFDPLGQVRFDRFEVPQGQLEEIGGAIASAIQRGIDMQGGFLEGKLDWIVARAQAIRKELDASKTTGDKKETGSPAAPTGDGNAKFLKELNSLLNSLNPIRAAQENVTDGMRVLDRAFQIGAISTEEYVHYFNLLHDQYQDALDPLAAYNRGLETEIGLLRMSASERELESAVRKVEQDLRNKGVALNSIELEQIRQQIAGHRELAEQVALQDSILEKAGARRTELATETANLIALVNSGDLALADAQVSVLERLNEAGIDTSTFAIQLENQRTQWLEYYAYLDELRANDLISEGDYARAKTQLQVQQQQAQIKFSQDFFGTLSELQSSSIRELAVIGKAAAIAQATINTYEGITRALANPGGVAGIALASVIAGVGAANVASIASTSAFAVGGQFRVAGVGGVDSQMVAFRASPGETVSVQTPTQARKGTGAFNSETPERKTEFNQKIVNVVDPNLLGDFMGSSEGEQTTINLIRRNSSTIRRALGID